VKVGLDLQIADGQSQNAQLIQSLQSDFIEG
jgi:hypothetical protein